MNKKALSIIGVIAAVIILGALYNNFLAPEGVEGEKEVGLQVIVDQEDINEEFVFETDHEFLGELLEEEQETLELTYDENSTMGMMITGMLGYEVDGTSEYFHILVNGEDAEYGASSIPLMDGDEYVLEIRDFSDYDGSDAEEAEEEEKEVSLQVILDQEDIDETFAFQTNHEFLGELIEEESETLEVEYEMGDFGLDILEILGYELDKDSEYLHILVNGEDAETGLSGIEVMDGDAYQLELRSFEPMEEEEAAAMDLQEVSLKVSIDTEDLEETFTFETEQEYLSGLIEDEVEVLEVEYEMGDFGLDILEILGYELDKDSEYLHILVNGEDAETGLSGIEIKDGDEYELQRRDF
ncbi:DUF4430 domain-containing protein [Isachenkonia alkalipeptolytica]|uniref:DUF4430 domain-containing protein n=1 Tax=Isachenkonia alkalipeptolytica TaxID=2565777 RepID=A0AA43XIG9_9CLOT|nr:DUF4430 domain-containing protein [Isachenkonia alkalipeptolytica]NBG86944.1 DUF4430 domain-containing protein [Isachenkonia alkalipeptolytica]